MWTILICTHFYGFPFWFITLDLELLTMQMTKSDNAPNAEQLHHFWHTNFCKESTNIWNNFMYEC